MRLWFGEWSDGKVTLAGHSIAALAQWAEASDSGGLTPGIRLEGLARESGLCASADEYRLLLHETALQVARDRIVRSLAGKDVHIVQGVRALDDLNEAHNILSERLAEWHGLRYPEEHVRANELVDHILREEGEGPAGTLAEDIAAIRELARATGSIPSGRKALEGYIKSSMEEAAPNLSNVLGPVLGARLIARAGSLGRLARMPASSIQVMGAGEALFRHLKAGTPSPKHGIIYKHPLISGAPKKARGRIARMLAGKAAIAARMDYYSGETMDFGDLKAKASAIKARARKGP